MQKISIQLFKLCGVVAVALLGYTKTEGMAPDSQRVFVAVPLPIHLQQDFGKLQTFIKNRLDPLLKPHSSQFSIEKSPHITLSFIGAVPVSKIPLLKSTIAGVVHSYTKAKKGLIAIGVQSGVALLGYDKSYVALAVHGSELDVLTKEIKAQLIQVGFPAPKLLRAHISLGRIQKIDINKNPVLKTQIDQLLATIKLPLSIQGGFSVSAVGLYESSGGQYKLLDQYGLVRDGNHHRIGKNGVTKKVRFCLPTDNDENSNPQREKPKKKQDHSSVKRFVACSLLVGVLGLVVMYHYLR